MFSSNSIAYPTGAQPFYQLGKIVVKGSWRAIFWGAKHGCGQKKILFSTQTQIIVDLL